MSQIYDKNVKTGYDANFQTGSQLNLLYAVDKSESNHSLDAYELMKPLKIHSLGYWEWGFLLSQIVLIIIYSQLTAYSPKSAGDVGLYPYFQDINVMIFIGFGFLMTFVKQMPWTSLSFNWILSIWAIEWAIISLGIWNGRLSGVPNDGYIGLRISLFIKAEFAAASAMIMYGAILGKCNLQQAFFLVNWMMWFYGLNDGLCNYKFHLQDVGGSITIHTFGAYFGLAASYFFQPKRAINSKNLQTNHQSEMIAMVGSIFLWIFWPSFNSALVGPNYVKQRTMINTMLSIGGSCIGAMSASRILLGKLDMEVMLNATLAGGVAIGSLADFVEQPWLAISIGTMAGIISALGFLILSSFLQKHIGLHDTCGVHNLHGIPGIFSAIMSMIVMGFYQHLSVDPESFPNIYGVFKQTNWSLHKQALAQLYSLLVTLTLAISTGFIGGFIASRKFFNPVHALFKDSENFHHVMSKYPKSYLKYGDEHYETALDLILVIKKYMIKSNNIGQIGNAMIENMINHIWTENNFDQQIDKAQTRQLIQKMFEIIDKTITVSSVGFQQLFELIDQYNRQQVTKDQILEFIRDFIKC